jgi:formamidopyrimidine-DNA glycosylase
MLRWPIPNDLPTILAQQQIKAVERRSKYILLRFQQGTLILHLGMSGVLRIVPSGTAAAKHDHVDIEFTNGICLRFSDPRRFGCILWTSTDPTQHTLLKNLGPEPLGHEFNTEYLFAKTRKKTVASKLFLMNSHHVVGVGNIYANEALFDAQIHPQKPAGKLSRDDCHALVESIKKILRKAIKHGGTTLKDFTQSDGKPGYFRNQLHVYGRGHQPCNHCRTILKESRISNRATVYCPTCQKS